MMMGFCGVQFGFQELKYRMVFDFGRGLSDAVMRCLCFWECVGRCVVLVDIGTVRNICRLLLRCERQSLESLPWSAIYAVLLVISQYTRKSNYTKM